jgi:PAS domain S-box-containing protein
LKSNFQEYIVPVEKTGEEDKIKEQLITQLQQLRKKVVGLEKSKARQERVENKLRESEEKYRASFEESRDAINIFSIEKKILDANEKLSQLSGYSKDELLSMKLQDIYPEASKPQTEERIKKMLKGEALPVFEAYLLTKSGKKVSVEIALCALQNCYGEKIVLQGNVRDITERRRVEEELRKHQEHLEELVEERAAKLKAVNIDLEREIGERKRAEEALRATEARFKELWNNAPAAYHTLNPEGIITSVNHTEAKMLGYSPEEMVGGSIFEFILPEQQDEARTRFKRKISGKHVPRAEDRIYVKKDGSKVYVVIDDVLDRDSNGRLIGVRTTMVDITEVKQAENLLRQSEEKHRLLAENAMDGIYIISTGGFEYVNPAFEKIFGYKEKEVCNRKFNFFDLIHADDRALVAGRQASRQKGEALAPEYSFRILPKDGQKIYIEFNTGTITYHGRPADLVVVQDISDRKKAEEDVRESKERYKDLVEKAGLAILVDDREGKLRYCNKNYAELFGYSMEEIKKQTVSTLVHDDDVE